MVCFNVKGTLVLFLYVLEGKCNFILKLKVNKFQFEMRATCTASFIVRDASGSNSQQCCIAVHAVQCTLHS